MVSVSGLVVPTQVGALVVPTATVAEVVSRPALKPLPSTARWVLGYFHWRNYPVTLVSFERLAADRKISEFSRVCVFYPLPGREPFDYFAFAISGEPRSLEISDSSEAGSLPAQVSPQFAAGALRIGDSTYVIPDFDRLKAAFYDE
jgi:chemosensory pili system protein ChpC